MAQLPARSRRSAAAFLAAAALAVPAALLYPGPAAARAAEAPSHEPHSHQAPSAEDPTLGPRPAAEPGPWQILEQRPGTGEQCLVCRQPIHDLDILEVRYKGRTFNVAEVMWGEFEAHPEQYFSTLEAHSALFDEAALEGPRVSHGWLYFGFYVLAGLISGALCAYIAVAKALPPLRWFFAGLVANAVALVMVVLRPAGSTADLPQGIPQGLATKVPTTRAPLACPACGNLNHPSASACSACGRALEPTAPSETAGLVQPT